jgi:hypothetical protein
MGLLDMVSRLVAGKEAGAARDAVEALTRSHSCCVLRAQQLRRHADLAPQEYSANGLQELASLEEGQAQRLKEALQAAGATVPTTPPTVPREALSHWARLVQDLEDHRTSTQALRQLFIKFAESLPQTAQLFEELCREEQLHCERLRALIARADPQALN